MRGVLLRVKEIMNEKHPSMYDDELATKARALIRDFGLRILPITDGNKRLLGVVSRGDIMAISSAVSPIRVRGIMSNPKQTALIEDDVYSTIKLMLRNDEWYSPVVDLPQTKTYKGVLGLENFIEAIIKVSPEKLSRQVSEIMSKNVVSCNPEDEIDNVWRLMQTRSFAGLPVTKNKKLVGIITQKDLLERGTLLPTFESAKGRHKASAKVSSVMETHVVAVKPSAKAISVAKLMAFKNFGRVPVKDEEGNLVGIVDREDIVKLIVK